jgi:signal transduction histidine kinase
MMRRILAAVFVALFLMTVSVNAADRGTAKEAQDLLKKAVAYYKENGQYKALAEFNNPNSKLFRDRDLYIVVWDMKGFSRAHGFNPALSNKDMWMLKDVDGKLFIQESVALAKKSNTGYLEYKWQDPITKKHAMRGVYFERVGDLIILSGFFK